MTPPQSHRLKAAVWRLIAENRNSRVLSTGAGLASSYLDAWWSRGHYRIDSDGEQRILDLLGNLQTATIFDVGANRGEWSFAARQCFPQARIFAFEPVPSTHELLRHAVAELVPPITVELTALGSADGTLWMRVPEPGSPLSTVLSESAEPGAIEVPATTIDHYCDTHAVSHIGMLKIDTEGHDHEVLRGGSRMISEGRVDVVQFEYGPWAIETRFLLRDFYHFFENAGLVVGKVFPNSVEFGPYRTALEDFRGLNYLAVRRDLTEVISSLAGN